MAQHREIIITSLTEDDHHWKQENGLPKTGLKISSPKWSILNPDLNQEMMDDYIYTYMHICISTNPTTLWETTLKEKGHGSHKQRKTHIFHSEEEPEEKVKNMGHPATWSKVSGKRGEESENGFRERGNIG